MSKDVSELVLPTDIRYSDDHEWARKEGENFKVGVSDYAQDQLGDIVFVELPEIGAQLSKGDEFGTLESVKAVSALYMPISGEIIAVNEALADAPEQVNSAPYGDGWMILVKPENENEFNELKSQSDYLEMLKG